MKRWKCKPRSEEHRRKLSETKLGEKNPAFGKPSWNKGLKGWTKNYKNTGFQKGHKSFHTESSIEKIRIASKKNGNYPPHPGSGEDNRNWIKDRNKLIKRQERSDSAYQEWRKNVSRRDNFACRIANLDCKGRIEVHHILSWRDYIELRYEINNGITLCRAHHPKRRAEEKQFIPYFMGLVETKV